jgi:hypothetical protein
VQHSCCVVSHAVQQTVEQPTELMYVDAAASEQQMTAQQEARQSVLAVHSAGTTANNNNNTPPAASCVQYDFPPSGPPQYTWGPANKTDTFFFVCSLANHCRMVGQCCDMLPFGPHWCLQTIRTCHGSRQGGGIGLDACWQSMCLLIPSLCFTSTTQGMVFKTTVLAAPAGYVPKTVTIQWVVTYEVGLMSCMGDCAAEHQGPVPYPEPVCVNTARKCFGQQTVLTWFLCLPNV